MKKVKLAKYLCKDVLNIKKKISIMALGQSQVGKTALVKKIFNLPNKIVKIKGGLDSDTDSVKTYTKVINGIELIYADSPGYFDSRGKDKNDENGKKILDYIQNNEIDIIFWVAKVGNICSLDQQDLLRQLIVKFGYGILKKMIIVLTHANCDAPIAYYKAYLKEKKSTQNEKKSVDIDDNINDNNDTNDSNDDDDDDDDDIIDSLDETDHVEVWKNILKLKRHHGSRKCLIFKRY